jgi:hypothetical protein
MAGLKQTYGIRLRAITNGCGTAYAGCILKGAKSVIRQNFPHTLSGVKSSASHIAPTLPGLLRQVGS